MGAWIEIRYLLKGTMSSSVAPLVGAWIEILLIMYATSQKKSLLSWERGLKWLRHTLMYLVAVVAPLVGAWIEIVEGELAITYRVVAPLVGAWIEIRLKESISSPKPSLLSWERGLKCQ